MEAIIVRSESERDESMPLLLLRLNQLKLIEKKRSLIITDLAIVWKGKNNEISDIDSIFHERAEIEIKLSADLGKGRNLGKNWLLRENWRWTKISF
ncbi:hypothetical protein [endosymbiont GvMRE of Glomus versiforme]|uniref:hypothetical protein n=1 Tax=endosymbiont GvMRE of Glomus versiforme TaxID=2039283 RepID=UPI001C0EA341|nr:hypothetical protein [endosymbiont GvMRE of Glomus versiforme]